MKKLLFINSSLSNGGAERVMTLLANEFAKRDYKVEMLIQNGKTPETYKLSESVKRYYFDSRGRKGARYTLGWMKSIRYTMKSSKYDVVISFMLSNNVLALAVNIGLKNRVIVSERCDPSRVKDYGAVFKFAEKILYPYAERIVVQTPDVAGYYKGRIRGKCTVIPNPVDNTNLIYADYAKRRNVFVSAGRLSEQKNYPMLIRAFSIFSKDNPGYELEIFGDGPLGNSLIELCRTLHVEDSVHFKGYVSNVKDYMRTATAFIMASDYEGISNAMIEALSMGVPTICTDCPVGGARMMIDSGRNGILVPVGAVEELAEAMARIVLNPDFAESLGKEAKKVVDEYSMSKIASKWEELF